MSSRKRSQQNSKRAVCILLVLLLLIFGAIFLADTFARYYASKSSGEAAGTAKWSVALKNGSESVSKSFNAALTPTQADNPHVGNGKFAPSTSMQATLVLDLTGTEVSVDYNIMANTYVLGNNSISVTVKDNGNAAVLGKDTYVPLVDGKPFTSENGIHEFVFEVKWAKDGNSNTDVNFALNNKTLSLPVSITVRQHIDGEEQSKVSQDISYNETTAFKPINKILDATNEDESKRVTVTKLDILSDNPERGFYSTSQLILNESGAENANVITQSSTGKLLQLKVDLSAFSGNMNADGTDKQLTADAITALENVLEQIKQNDNTVILRFVYDNFASGDTDVKVAGKTKIEPSQDMLLKHIGALGGTFRKYASTINIIQIGFYGLWGECYYFTDCVENGSTYYPQTVQKLLDETSGTEITIAVRATQYYAWYRGIDVTTVGNEGNFPDVSDDAYRVGLFNDAYGANETDMGTYYGADRDVAWWSYQTGHTYYGGEPVPSARGAGLGTYTRPENFVTEAKKLHTSYLNWEWDQEIHAQWALTSYGNGDVYDNTALAYIDSRLGYRFLVEDVKTYPKAAAGNTLPIDITVRNLGFGNLVKSKQSDIVIVDSAGNTVAEYKDVALDAREFVSQSSVTKSLNLTLPFTLQSGKYSVYLRISSGETLNGGRYYSAIRFANENMWDNNLQANYIAAFEVQ